MQAIFNAFDDTVGLALFDEDQDPALVLPNRARVFDRCPKLGATAPAGPSVGCHAGAPQAAVHERSGATVACAEQSGAIGRSVVGLDIGELFTLTSAQVPGEF